MAKHNPSSESHSHSAGQIICRNLHNFKCHWTSSYQTTGVHYEPVWSNLYTHILIPKILLPYIRYFMIIQETSYPFVDTSIFCLSSATKYLNKDIHIARVQFYSKLYRKAGVISFSQHLFYWHKQIWCVSREYMTSETQVNTLPFEFIEHYYPEKQTHNTHTHTHTYIYIYIRVCVCFVGVLFWIKYFTRRTVLTSKHITIFLNISYFLVILK